MPLPRQLRSRESAVVGDACPFNPKSDGGVLWSVTRRFTERLHDEQRICKNHSY